jgi:hypothetical protein
MSLCSDQFDIWSWLLQFQHKVPNQHKHQARPLQLQVQHRNLQHTVHLMQKVLQKFRIRYVHICICEWIL